jgi:cyanophycinase
MSSASSGSLFVIGGAEDKLRRRSVLSTFVKAAGGAQARIAVVPTASSLGPEIVEVYETVFGKLGAHAFGIRPEDRRQANDPDFVKVIEEATGIFMTGGNQLKLSGVIAGTAFGEAIKQAHSRGIPIAGTSAGASIQSSHMVAFGVGGTTPKQRMTQVAAGLGLVQGAVIDQHFDQRNRYGRLLMIVSESPHLLGIGVDEDTAAVITHTDSDERMHVIGRGAVTIFDGMHMDTNAHEVKRNQPIMASGVTLHVLPAGSSFSLTSRSLIHGPGNQIDQPTGISDLASPGHDLRKLAQDIAAGDVSPSVLRRRTQRRIVSAQRRSKS